MYCKSAPDAILSARSRRGFQRIEVLRTVRDDLVVMALAESSAVSGPTDRTSRAAVGRERIEDAAASLLSTSPERDVGRGEIALDGTAPAPQASDHGGRKDFDHGAP